jgi:hypothetical protein
MVKMKEMETIRKMIVEQLICQNAGLRKRKKKKLSA